MEIALQFTQDVLEDEVSELRPASQGLLYVAIALYFGCNVIALTLFAMFTGTPKLSYYLIFFLVFNVLSYGIGQFLDGARSEVGHQIMDRSVGFGRMMGGSNTKGALGMIGMAVIVLQFLFFGVYTCVAQFRECLNSKGDNRSRIAAALVKHIVEQGPTTEARAAEELQNAGVEKEQAQGIIDFLKDKTVLCNDQDGNLALSVPAKRWFS